MSLADLEKTIEAAFEARDTVSPSTKGEIRDAVNEALNLLDSGKARVAEKIAAAAARTVEGQSVAQEGGAAVVPAERHGADLGRSRRGELVGQGALQIRRLGRDRTCGGGLPLGARTAIVRRSAYIAPGVVLMPSFVNLGAYVDSGTMVDTWATVGSCAQIGKNVHLSGGVGIGGVLEPLQADPTIIEDNCFIGARSEVVEGVVVGRGLGARRWASSSAPRPRSSTARPARSTSAMCRPIRSSCRAPCPAQPLPDGQPGPSLYCAVIVKTVDAQTRSKTGINELLRD